MNTVKEEKESCTCFGTHVLDPLDVIGRGNFRHLGQVGRYLRSVIIELLFGIVLKEDSFTRYLKHAKEENSTQCICRMVFIQLLKLI